MNTSSGILCVACEGKPSGSNNPCAVCGCVLPTIDLVRKLIDQDNASERNCHQLAESLGEQNSTYNELKRDAAQYHQSAYRLGLVLKALEIERQQSIADKVMVEDREILAELGDVPANCRERLQREGKPYPKSSCAACGKFAPNWRDCDALLAAEAVKARRATA
jgi:hypothetical protein